MTDSPQGTRAQALKRTSRGIQIKQDIGATILPGNPAATLPIAVITIDEAIQQRASMDAELVLEYQTNIGEWIAQAPVIVYGIDGAYWLADGFHRIAAAIGAGLAEIPAIIHPGARRDALLYAIGANASHGKPRTNADKRRAVETLLADVDWSCRSDRWIAETAKVSDKTVTKIRFEVRKSAIEHDGIEPEPIPQKRIGQDGKERTLPPPDPEKLALLAELEQVKKRSEEWRAQALAEKKTRQDAEAKLKDKQEELKDAESVHREHQDEMRKQVAEQERNRPRTDAEEQARQAKLNDLNAAMHKTQTAINQAAKEKADLEKALLDLRKESALQDRVLNDWGTAAIGFREVALRLSASADALKKIPMTQALYEQVAMMQALTADVAGKLSEAVALDVAR